MRSRGEPTREVVRGSECECECECVSVSVGVSVRESRLGQVLRKNVVGEVDGAFDVTVVGAGHGAVDRLVAVCEWQWQ